MNMTLRDAIFKKMREEWRKEMGSLLLTKSADIPAPSEKEDDELIKRLPPALRGDAAVRQFVDMLRNLIREKDVDGWWTGDFPKIIDDGLAQYSGKYFSLLELCGDARTAAKYAELFGIPTAAICRFRIGKDPTYRTVLAISPQFVRALPIQSAIDAAIFIHAINLAVRELGSDVVLSELQGNGAPPDVVGFFHRMWGGETPTLHSILSQLIDISLTRQYKVNPTARFVGWGLVSILRYSPSLFDKVSDIKVAIAVDADTLMAMRAQEGDEESSSRLEELMKLREKFVAGLSRELSSIPPDFIRNLGLSVLHDARDLWNAILFHEVGHLVGDHTLPVTMIEDSRWINKYVARRLVELAQQHGRGKRIEFPNGVTIEVSPPPPDDDAAFAAEVDKIRKTLDNLVAYIFTEEGRKLPLARLYDEALNHYYDLIVNNAVFEYLLRRSPTGVLSLVYRYVVPYAFGLPTFAEAVTNPQLSEADIYTAYRRKIGEELADALWREEHEDVDIKNGGIGNGIKGKSRVKGRMSGKRRSIWDWDEDNTGDVEDKGTVDEEDIEEGEGEEEDEGKGKQKGEEEKKEDEEGKEDEGAGKQREDESEKEEGKGIGERKEDEEEEKDGATDEEVKNAQNDLEDALRRILHRHGLEPGALINPLRMRPAEREEVPPPVWHEELRTTLELMLTRLQPQEPGEEKRSYYRESRKPVGLGEDTIYVSRPGREFKINFVVVQDVSGSMSHLYNEVVSHFVGWLTAHQWDMARRMVMGVEKIGVNIFFLPIDTVIHKIGWWSARGGGEISEFAQNSLLGVAGGGTDIYGVSQGSLGLRQFIKVMFDPTYREKVLGEARETAEREEDERIVRVSRHSDAGLARALNQLGVFAAATEENWNDAWWVFIIATDHQTELGDRIALRDMVDTLNSKLPSRYMVFYLLYNADKEQTISELEEMWRDAKAIPLTAGGYNIITIRPGIFAFFVDTQRMVGRARRLEERAETEIRGEREEEEETSAVSPPESKAEEPTVEKEPSTSVGEEEELAGDEVTEGGAEEGAGTKKEDKKEELKKAFLVAVLRYLAKRTEDSR